MQRQCQCICDIVVERIYLHIVSLSPMEVQHLSHIHCMRLSATASWPNTVMKTFLEGSYKPATLNHIVRSVIWDWYQLCGIRMYVCVSVCLCAQEVWSTQQWTPHPINHTSWALLTVINNVTILTSEDTDSEDPSLYMYVYVLSYAYMYYVLRELVLWWLYVVHSYTAAMCYISLSGVNTLVWACIVLYWLCPW